MEKPWRIWVIEQRKSLMDKKYIRNKSKQQKTVCIYHLIKCIAKKICMIFLGNICDSIAPFPESHHHH